MRGEQRLKHLAADRREALAALRADHFRMVDRIGRAAAVVVIGSGKAACFMRTCALAGFGRGCQFSHPL